VVDSRADWNELESALLGCRRCSRLIAHCSEIARVRRRAYRDQEYWAGPVAGFGDRAARLMLLGLAPGAHGANRTGRMFTGDRSGEWLYRALHRAGLANQPDSRARDDGLRLRHTFISAVCRCAPPANRPTKEEMERCREYLDREIELLPKLAAIVALGKIAWDAALRRALRLDPHALPRPRPRFAHGAEIELPLAAAGRPCLLIGCYHPSQQNTQTGRLTESMLDRALSRASEIALADA